MYKESLYEQSSSLHLRSLVTKTRYYLPLQPLRRTKAFHTVLMMNKLDIGMESQDFAQCFYFDTLVNVGQGVGKPVFACLQGAEQHSI